MNKFKAAIIAVCITSIASANPFDNENVIFTDVSQEIVEMQKFFYGDYNEGIEFDYKSADLYGYSKKSILISMDMVELSNKFILLTKKHNGILVSNTKSSKMNISHIFSNIDILDYPNFSWFMGSLKKYNRDGLNNKKLSNVTKGLFDAMEICGSYWNPKPSSAAPWVGMSVGNYNQTVINITNQGFHQTSSSFGGGWTRPQSHQSWICGTGSFRDHITFNSAKTVMNTQDYAGYSPRGEPNPEINSYVWPYAAWPSYVFWWHSTY